MKFHSYYNRPIDAGVDFTVVDPETGEVVPEVSRTKQADKDSCDINRILARYEQTGQLPELIRQDARFGDFSAVPDFLEAMNLVSVAQAQFDALDARVRARFGNDPAQMLEFVANPKNAKEMVELGLALPRQPDPGPGAVGGAPAASAPPASPAKGKDA